MKTVTFYGSSDDLVEIGGIDGADEFNIIKDTTHIATFSVWSDKKKEGLKVLVCYNGTWSFAPALFDEDETFPEWKLMLKASKENAYSMGLSIEVPDDAYLCRIEN